MIPFLPRRALEVLVLAALVAALVHDAATPPRAVPATAPDTAFSAERAMRHVRAIAQRPHPTTSPDHARVRGYLVTELRALGLEVQVHEGIGIGTRYRMAGSVQNVVARLRGTGNGGRAVLLAAHYDSQGASPGAGDDASATGALLETMRALRAGPPLANDLVVLLTDAEETGLVGAAAFVQEHPWAGDVDVMLNFEARGTGGRAFMFETGAGNLDLARVLRAAPDVSASSLMVMVYRILPNDTDLSELRALARPAMNFAFIDGVERYHTAHDDVAHLEPGSVQHHGEQALALARALGDAPLPRPVTGDAVFFDVPLVGLIVYPESWAWVVALLALSLAVVLAVRVAGAIPHPIRDVVLGTGGMLAGVACGAAAAAAVGMLALAMHARTGWGGAAEWRGIYAAAAIAAGVAASSGVWVLLRRWASAAGAHAGQVLALALLAVVVTALARGASYLLAWPVLVVAATELAAGLAGRDAVRVPLRWIGIVAVLVTLVPLLYLLGEALGIQLPGAVAAGAIAGIATALLAPTLEQLVAPRRWLLPAIAAGAMVATFGAGAVTVRPSAAYPVRQSLRHDVDVTPDPAAPPSATILRDSAAADIRFLTIRVVPPESTWVLRVSADGAITDAHVAGRWIDESRYRRASRTWEIGYVAPPDTGIVLLLATPAGDGMRLRLTAERAGVPDEVRGRTPRPAHHVPTQRGDLTVVHRQVVLP